METIPKLFVWYYQLKRGGNIFCETVSLICGLSVYLFKQKNSMLQSGSIFSSVMTKPMNNIFNYPRLLRQKCPIESLMKRRTTVNIRDAHSIVLMWSMLFMHRERGKRLKGTLSRDF